MKQKDRIVRLLDIDAIYQFDLNFDYWHLHHSVCNAHENEYLHYIAVSITMLLQMS